MDINLTTDRLLLRPLQLEDVDLGYELFTDPEVMHYVGDISTRQEIAEEMPTYLRRGPQGRLGVWCVTDKKTGEKYGTSVLLPLPIDIEDTDWDLVRPDLWPDAEIEVGYILKKSAWGKGIATEACMRLRDFFFETSSMNELAATTDLENHASGHVLKKCGLKDRGVRTAYQVDCKDYRITRQEWQALVV